MSSIAFTLRKSTVSIFRDLSSPRPLCSERLPQSSSQILSLPYLSRSLLVFSGGNYQDTNLTALASDLCLWAASPQCQREGSGIHFVSV